MKVKTIPTKVKVLNPKSVRFQPRRGVKESDVTVSVDLIGDGAKVVKGKTIRIIEYDVDGNPTSDQILEPVKNG